MLILKLIIILISFTLLAWSSYYYHTAVKIEDIRFFNLVTEGLIAVGFAFFYIKVDALLEKHYHKYLSWGFYLSFVSLTTDALDQFNYHGEIYTAILEKTLRFVGYALIFVGVKFWLDEHIKMNKSLSKEKELAQAATDAKSQFLANMSHEIRTPMNGVLGTAQLLKVTNLDDRQSNYVSRLITSGNQLMSIINDILDFSKITANKFELIERPFEIKEVLAEVEEMMSSFADEKELGFVSEIELDSDDVLIGDEVRLKQVLTNLLSNAIKFTEKGSVTMEAKLIQSNSIQSIVEFAVRDTGIGIPEDSLNSIFDDFTQVESSSSNRTRGTGLGLAICKNLVNLMGGVLKVDSQVGVGSRFYFTLSFQNQ